jgi:hypothetical protein
MSFVAQLRGEIGGIFHRDASSNLKMPNGLNFPAVCYTPEFINVEFMQGQVIQGKIGLVGRRG